MDFIVLHLVLFIPIELLNKVIDTLQDIISKCKRGEISLTSPPSFVLPDLASGKSMTSELSCRG